MKHMILKNSVFMFLIAFMFSCWNPSVIDSPPAFGTINTPHD